MNGNRNCGFALLDVLIGAFIFGLAALGVTLVQAKLIKAITLTGQNSEASIIAQQRIESMRNITTTAGYTALTTGSDVVSGQDATYNRSWTVTTNATPAYKSIRVTVSWTSAEGVTESVSRTSIISSTDPAANGRSISR